MTDYLFSSTETLVDSVYPVVVVDLLEAGGAAAVPQKNPVVNNLEFGVANVYQLRFHDKLNSGRGEAEDASVILECRSAKLFTWPVEYIRRYGCETKNIFILELGRRCAGFPNKTIRFDTRPAKASTLESDFGRLVKKVLKFMDPAAKALAKKQVQQRSGATALLAGLMKNQSPIQSNAVSCEYAELAPYQPKEGERQNNRPPPPPPEPSTHYARVIVKQP